MNVTYSEAAREWDEKTGLLTLMNQSVESEIAPEVTSPIEVEWDVSERSRRTVVTMTLRNPDGESVETFLPENLHLPVVRKGYAAGGLLGLLQIKARRMIRELAESEV